MPEEVFVIIMVVFFTLVLPMSFILGVPASKALRRRLEGGESESSSAVLEERDHLRHRVEELEERQDFADRLLAQGRGEKVSPAH